MLAPKPEAVAKYQSLCPGFKQFAVVEEYELPNFPGWEVLKIFITKEVVDSQQGISIDAWNCGSASDSIYIGTPKKEPKRKQIDVRKYLIGLKDSDVIDNLAKELMAKAKEIRDLNFKLIELRQENRTTRDMLQNEVDAYRGRSAERERLAERLSGRVRELEDEIEELKKHKENKIVYGATEEIKPAIRHLDLDD
jgi:hypothetical protein